MMEDQENEHNNLNSISPNYVRIKVHGCENIVPIYPVADVVMKFEFGESILYESEKIFVENNKFLPVDYEVLLPCDFSSFEDLDKYISRPIIITITETLKEIDMSKIEVLVGKNEGSVEKIDSVPNTETMSNKSKSSLKVSKKSKEKRSKPKENNKKESKLKKAKGYFDTKPDTKDAQQLTGPQILGTAMLDLLPLFLGKTEFSEALYIRPVQKYFDEKAVALEDVPKLQVTVFLDGSTIDQEKSSVFHISIESIYNIPNMLTTNYRYQLSVILPINSEQYESIPFENGTYALGTEFIKYKFWPLINSHTPIESTYRVDNEISAVVNNNDINLEGSINIAKPRIQYNIIKRMFLSCERKERIFKYIRQYRKIAIEIYISPMKQESIEEGITKKKESKASDKKDKNSKGKSSATTIKSKKTNASTSEESSEYLHLMAIVNVDQLLYPGVKSTRVACLITTYHEQEVLKLTGVTDSHYRPKPVEILDEVCNEKEGDKKTQKAAKKEPKGSDSSKKSDKNKKGKGKKEQSEDNKAPATDLASKLPPGPLPIPEPSKQVFNEKGEPTFIIVEFSFTKPLHAERKLDDLANKLNTIIKKPSKLPKAVVSSSVGQEIYNETIRTITKDMNYQYQKFKEQKKQCKCEHTLDFLSYLQQSGVYQTYLATITRALASLIPEKYQLKQEWQNKSSKEYQGFIKRVHSDMVEQTNTIVNELVICNINKLSHKHMVKNEQLLLYAKEVTELDEYDLAERYYLERICCNENNANCWFDYAIFLMEINNPDKSIECLKEVLSLDSTHRYGLLMYGLILFEKSKIAEAETCLLTMTLMHPRWPEGWFGLFLYYSEIHNVEGMELTLQMANKYYDDPGATADYFGSTDDLAWSSQFCDGNIYLKAAILLIKMRLHQFAEKALAYLMPHNNGQKEYLTGVMAYLTKNYRHSLEHVEVAKHLLGLADYGMCMLMGNCYLKMGNHNDALVFYEMALSMYNRPDDVHLVYLFAAISYDIIGDSQKARKLVLMGCKHSPTPQTWMHAGSYYFKQNDLLSAEQCLLQANLCDNRLPDPWAYLSLINAYLGKQYEAELCLTQAKRFDGKDLEIVRNVEKAINSMQINQ